MASDQSCLDLRPVGARAGGIATDFREQIYVYLVQVHMYIFLNLITSSAS